MKNIFVLAVTIGLVMSSYVYGETRTIEKVDYVYVLDAEKSFDFSGGNTHECGSNLYRTITPTEEIANRKFSVVLTAFSAGKKVILNTEGCSGNRMLFGWVRVSD